jgi:hypothetical protein
VEGEKRMGRSFSVRRVRGEMSWGGFAGCA